MMSVSTFINSHNSDISDAEDATRKKTGMTYESQYFSGTSTLFSIVVLTYNRKDVLADLLNQLLEIERPDVEVIIVDNSSTDGTDNLVKSRFPEFKYLKLPKNYGAVGRSQGMALAIGKYVVTIDDDILGLDASSLEEIHRIFEQSSTAGAICFKVIDYYSGSICNWCHPKHVKEFADCSFETCEISEGAAVFRRNVLDSVGLYPEDFFISHEGADLAARIIDHGFDIYYSPLVKVLHKYATQGRPGWRRYYYDTRNDFWLAIRNYRLIYLILHLIRRVPVTFIYAVRDGFFLYWLRAIRDVLQDMPLILSQRRPVSWQTHKKINFLNRDKAGFYFLIKERLFSRQIKL